MDREFHDFQLPISIVEKGVILCRNEKGCYTNVPHLVTHHSPTGFEWGFGGSGPADLALNILEFFLNHLGHRGRRTKCWDGDCWTLAYALHQKFKLEFIAPAHRQEVQIPYGAIVSWIQAQPEVTRRE